MSDAPVTKKGNWVDTLAELMQKKLVYNAHEYDMIILHHIFGVEWPNGQLVGSCLLLFSSISSTSCCVY